MTAGSQDVFDALAGSHDFGDGEGPVPAHRHVNPDGTVGGWISDAAVFDDRSQLWLGPGASIGGTVTLTGKVVVDNNARVQGTCHLRNCRVLGRAVVAQRVMVGHRRPEMGMIIIQGAARVEGHNVTLSGHTKIFGSAHVTGTGTEIRDSSVGGHAQMLGGLIYESTLRGNAIIRDDANVSGGAMIQGDAIIKDKARVHGQYVIQDDVVLHGEQELSGGRGTFGIDEWRRWLDDRVLNPSTRI